MQLFTIYAKDEYPCPFCVKAKELLEDKFEQINVVNVPTDLPRDKLKQLVEGYHSDNPDWSLTVPQIFVQSEDGQETYIGGYTDLVEWYDKKEQDGVDSALDDLVL